MSRPLARSTVFACTPVARAAVEAVRGAGGEQGSAERGIAEDAVGLGLAGAVAEVEAEIRPGPAPRGHDRRLGEPRRAIAGGALVIAFRCLAGRRLGAELGVHEKFDAAP